MATTFKDPIYCGDKSGKLQAAFTNGNGTTPQDITTADANGPVRIDMLAVSNDDTAAGVMNIYIHDNTAAQLVAVIPIAANSLLNTGANSPVNILTHANMAPFVGSDAAGNKYLELPKNYKLQASMVAAPTSGKVFRTAATWGIYAA